MKKFNDGTGAQYLAEVRKRLFGGLTQADYDGQNQPAAVANNKPFVDISAAMTDICEVCERAFPPQKMVNTASGDRVCIECSKLP